PQDPGGAVVLVAVDQEAVHLGEAVSVAHEELRMVERVVEERRELEAEVVPLDDVLVEGEVHHPGAGAEEAALARVPELTGSGEAVGRLVEERVTGSARVRVVELVR